MGKVDCFFEKVSHFGVAMALLFIGMGLSVMGGTILTLLVFLAAPVFLLAAFYFLFAESSDCAIFY